MTNAAAAEMLTALRRALFVLESPSMPAFVNAAGTVDEVRAAIAKAEAAGIETTAPARWNGQTARQRVGGTFGS